MDYSVKYYNDRLNESEKLGKILGMIEFPLGRPYQFLIAILTMSAMLSTLISSFYYVFPVLGFAACVDYYFKYKLREDLLNMCLVDEVYMEIQANENNEDPIDDEDRISIYSYNYSLKSCKPNFLQNIKLHYKELLQIAALEIFIYILFKGA
jgi:hypothetical protein